MGNIVLKVYLQPKSSKNGIVGPFRDGIKVKVTAPPAEEKANEALLKVLSGAWGISSTQIEILKGRHSRKKTLRLSGVKDREPVEKSTDSLPKIFPEMVLKKPPAK